ncbi:hypothetical protein [Micromonospora sp. NPDC006431]|uniref:DedA family protein n=1 Tax=Micromonospora sp. NPDC006431 TaxID=3364235 RepID=UPI0036C015B6
MTLLDSLLDRLDTLPPGYVLLAAAAVLAAEVGLLVGLVLPAATTMLTVGLLARAGRLDLGLALAVTTLAAFAGDQLGYLEGRLLGPRLRRGRLGRWVGERRWQRAETLVAARGGPAVLLGPVDRVRPYPGAPGRRGGRAAVPPVRALRRPGGGGLGAGDGAARLGGRRGADGAAGRRGGAGRGGGRRRCRPPVPGTPGAPPGRAGLFRSGPGRSPAQPAGWFPPARRRPQRAGPTGCPVLNAGPG